MLILEQPVMQLGIICSFFLYFDLSIRWWSSVFSFWRASEFVKSLYINVYFPTSTAFGFFKSYSLKNVVHQSSWMSVQWWIPWLSLTFNLENNHRNTPLVTEASCNNLHVIKLYHLSLWWTNQSKPYHHVADHLTILHIRWVFITGYCIVSDYL